MISTVVVDVTLIVAYAVDSYFTYLVGEGWNRRVCVYSLIPCLFACYSL